MLIGLALLNLLSCRSWSKWFLSDHRDQSDQAERGPWTSGGALVPAGTADANVIHYVDLA